MWCTVVEWMRLKAVGMALKNVGVTEGVSWLRLVSNGICSGQKACPDY